jgi:hypothetical protein
MVSKKLMIAWAFLAFALLAASGVLIAFSIVWQSASILLHFVISHSFLTSGLILGIAFAVTFLISIAGIVQRYHITIGLTLLSWALVIDAFAILAIGTMIWFFTLQERDNYHVRFAAASDDVRQKLQDHFSCCGYFNSTDLMVGAGFCSDTSFAATTQPCVSPITNFADFTLNNIFTTIYGFMAIVVGLFLANLCVVAKRAESERFRKIDLKRGGKGFV